MMHERKGEENCSRWWTVKTSTLLHWNSSPSSNWSVRVPTGSNWIERPQNLLFKLLSPQNFQPLPSQWHATIMGWWLTCKTVDELKLPILGHVIEDLFNLSSICSFPSTLLSIRSTKPQNNSILSEFSFAKPKFSETSRRPSWRHPSVSLLSLHESYFHLSLLDTGRT